MGEMQKKFLLIFYSHKIVFFNFPSLIADKNDNFLLFHSYYPEIKSDKLKVCSNCDDSFVVLLHNSCIAAQDIGFILKW